MEQEKQIIRETDAEAIRLAKTLLRTARYGALAVLDPKSGAPLASRVAVATDLDGTPLILVSSLSEHTGGLARRPALLAAARRTRQGRSAGASAHQPALPGRAAASAARRRRSRAERRYLNRHPKAKLYAGFGDFAFFRLEVERASLNGGFGKAYHLTRDRSRFRRPGKRRARRGRAAGDRPHERRP